MHATFRPLLACALAITALAAHAGDDLRRFQSAAYDVTTDLPHDVAEEVVAHMDAVHVEYTRRFGAYGKRNAEPLRLWVFATQNGYAEFLAGHGINSMGTGGMFFRTDDASGLASFLGNRPLETMLETLRHEGMHQVVYQRIGDTVPAWLNEGMAEWFGYAVPTRRGFAMGLADPRAVHRLQAAVQKDALIPLPELLRMSKQDWNTRVNSGMAGAQYDQAWSVVHFLANADNGRYQRLLDVLLRSFWSGLNDDQAIEAAFGRDLGPMDEAWRRYVAELEPDELYRAMDQMEAYGALLAALDAVDVRPADPEAFERALAERGELLDLPESVTISEGPAALTLDPDAWWRTPPTAARTRRPAVLRFIPDRRGDLPPAVQVRGLRNRVGLEWTRSRDGELSHRVVVD